MKEPPAITLQCDLTLYAGQQMALGTIEYARLHTNWRLVTGDAPAAATLTQTFAPTPGVQIQVSKTRKSAAVCSDPDAVVQNAIAHLNERGFTRFMGVGLSTVALSAFSATALPQDSSSRFNLRRVRPGGPSFRGDETLEERSARADPTKKIDPGTAVVCATEILACAFAEQCKVAGIAIPRDIAILSLRNAPLTCELTTPPISSVDHDAHRIGYEAARILDRMLSGKSTPPTTLLPPLGITARASTDVLAIDDPDIARAVRFIRANAHRPLAIADVLRDVPLHRRALERGFRKALGRSPAEELRHARITLARELLARTDLPIAQIATRCGFILPQHLTTAFKLSTGQTPSGYRGQFYRN